MTLSPPAARTYQVRTFGCQMNVHDSERLSGLLEDAGVPVDEHEGLGAALALGAQRSAGGEVDGRAGTGRAVRRATVELAGAVRRRTLVES